MLNVLYSPFLNEAPEARRPDCDQEVSTDLSADLELPNLKGKVVVMNQGLEGDFSEETSKELIALGAKVYIFDQHVLKKQGVCEKDYGDHCLIECDMTNLESVQHAALIFLAYEEKLHCLFLNGQVTNPVIHNLFGKDFETRQGHEYHMGINVLAQHLLVQLLKPALFKANSNPNGDNSRIIFTTPQNIHLDPSQLHGMHSDHLEWDPTDEASQQYGHHKRCIRSRLAFFHEAMIEADLLSGKGVIVGFVPPVEDPSNHYYRHAVPYWTGKLKSLLWPSHTLSLLQIHAALSPVDMLEDMKIVPWSHRQGGKLQSTPSPDVLKALKTWQWCEEKTKDYRKETLMSELSTD